MYRVAVSVWPVMDPLTIRMAPISPIARAVVSAMPYSRPHRMFFSVTRKNVCHDDAPSVLAASSSETPSSCKTGTTSRMTNGMQMKIVTSTIEGTANRICIPRAANHGANHPRDNPAEHGRDDDGDRSDDPGQHVCMHDVRLGEGGGPRRQAASERGPGDADERGDHERPDVQDGDRREPSVDEEPAGRSGQTGGPHGAHDASFRPVGSSRSVTRTSTKDSPNRSVATAAASLGLPPLIS